MSRNLLGGSFPEKKKKGQKWKWGMSGSSTCGTQVDGEEARSGGAMSHEAVLVQ